MPVHARMLSGVEECFISFLSSSLDEGIWLASRPGRLMFEEGPRRPKGGPLDFSERYGEETIDLRQPPIGPRFLRDLPIRSLSTF